MTQCSPLRTNSQELLLPVYDATDEAATIKATTIVLPDRVFDYLQRQMVIPEWGKTTKFDPLTEEMVINGISITRGGDKRSDV
jgi:hypothetical protein